MIALATFFTMALLVIAAGFFILARASRHAGHSMLARSNARWGAGSLVAALMVVVAAGVILQ